MADPDLQLRRGPAFKGLTMNVEFCKGNSGTSKKMRYFRKNKVGAWPHWAPLLDPPLAVLIEDAVNILRNIYRTKT